MIMNRMGDIERKLYTMPYDLVEYYQSLTEQQIVDAKQKLIKEYEINRKNNKPNKTINDILEITDLVLELKSLQDMIKSEQGDNDNKGVVIG